MRANQIILATGPCDMQGGLTLGRIWSLGQIAFGGSVVLLKGLAEVRGGREVFQLDAPTRSNDLDQLGGLPLPALAPGTVIPIH